MTREAESLCHVDPMSGGLGSRHSLNRAFSAWIMHVSNPWGDAPGCNDAAPLALKDTQAAYGFD
jgi:hypothetical protein